MYGSLICTSSDLRERGAGAGRNAAATGADAAAVGAAAVAADEAALAGAAGAVAAVVAGVVAGLQKVVCRSNDTVTVEANVVNRGRVWSHVVDTQARLDPPHHLWRQLFQQLGQHDAPENITFWTTRRPRSR